MQNLIVIAALAMLSTSAFFTKDENKVEKIAPVDRCQAVRKDGLQCAYRAERGKKFCWQHGAANAVNEVLSDAGEGSKRAWKSTKTWSTNAWASTKSGWNKAVDATKESLDDARVGMIELFGGKDSGKDSQKAVR